MKIRLSILSTLFFQISFAQIGPIWAGYNILNRIQKQPYIYQAHTHLVIDKKSNLPDSLLYQYYFVSDKNNGYLLNKTYTCDSFLHVEYVSKILEKHDAFGEKIQPLLPYNSIVGGYNSPDSLDPYNLFFTYLYDDENASRGPELNLKTIYHNPREPLRASFWSGNNTFDNKNLYFNDFGHRNLLNYNLIPATIITRINTGDVIWKNIKSEGDFTFGYQILAPVHGDYNHVFYLYSVNLDNAITSTFNFDSTLINDEGFIIVNKDIDDTARFEFSLQGEPSDQLSITFNSALTGYGGQPPLIRYTKSGNETKVNFSLYIDSINAYHLPCSFNFIFTRQNPGEKCINRFFSFIIEDKSTSIIEEELKTLKLFPNPSHDIVFISTMNEISYEIYNLSGIKIQNGTTRGEIKTSSLIEGLYFIKFYSKQDSSKNFKLFISRAK